MDTDGEGEGEAKASSAAKKPKTVKRIVMPVVCNDVVALSTSVWIRHGV